MKTLKELSTRSRVFALLQEEKINKITSDYMAQDSDHLAYTALLERLLSEDKITYDEYEIIERETVLEFSAFVDNLDQIPEIRIIV